MNKTIKKEFESRGKGKTDKDLIYLTPSKIMRIEDWLDQVLDKMYEQGKKDGYDKGYEDGRDAEYEAENNPNR